MTELEIDQSHLPCVQEVCQCFAVLEDGALAHNLQEQEIEQYYTTNIQKNQLVQNDIRIAKRLQDEEEELRARQRTLLSQATRQLEEQDSEYARMIQEEIQRCAEEEARRREQEDEEIAKQIQEEEEHRLRQRSSGRESLSDGAGLQSQGACLDLGELQQELQQVLRDEELARRLQEEEERLMRRIPQPVPSPHSSYPEGDFRVAQVAQDEEIARFMQKQEMKSKRLSREMDNPGSWRDPREMAHTQDRRPPRVRRRERLDSEGLPSPSEDCSPDQHPASPASTGLEVSVASHGRADTLQQAHPIRNIAEELDPTFKARRQSKDTLRLGPTISGPPVCQSSSVPQSGLHNFLEEPTFIPPTKRHSDKSGRIKLKEKKENCKQQ